MTLRAAWLSFIKALLACILALGPAVAFAFLLTAAELPPGIPLTFLIWGACAVLIKNKLDSQARGN